MSKAFPGVFYHSLSQSRLSDAVQKDALPGLSRFHLDPDGKSPGVWLSDSLSFVARENRYGREQSDEVLDTWDADFMRKITGKDDAEVLVITKPIPPVVLKIEGLDEDRLLQHPLLPVQFFYRGDIDWSRVKSFMYAEHDDEAMEAARKLSGVLRERGIEITVEGYKPSDVMEGLKIKTNENNFKYLPRIDTEGSK